MVSTAVFEEIADDYQEARTEIARDAYNSTEGTDKEKTAAMKAALKEFDTAVRDNPKSPFNFESVRNFLKKRNISKLPLIITFIEMFLLLVQKFQNG